MFINDKEYCGDFLRLEQGVHTEFSSGQNKQKRHELEPFAAEFYSVIPTKLCMITNDILGFSQEFYFDNFTDLKLGQS